MMNKFIKFRAWIEEEERFPTVEQMKIFDSVVYVYDSDIDHEYQIDIEHLMQSTGLIDQNRKEIYDCDIVKIWHEDEPENFSIGKVIWNLGGEYPAFDVYIPTDNSNLSFDAYSHEYNSFSCPDYCIEVIGNIYESPELLTIQEINDDT